MNGFKGFDKDLKCRDKQYEVGKTFEEEAAVLCKKGLHFCQNPHDVFIYYPAGAGNRFCEVVAEDVSDQKEIDSKRVAKKLTIKAEISVFQVCKIAVSTFFSNFNFSEKIKSAASNQVGDNEAANAGNYGAANAGDRGAANAGNYGAANAGDYGAANAGDRGAANAGYRGAANAGNYGAANAGDCGAANTGNYGAANAGDCGAASVMNNGVAIASTKGRVKGGLGSILVLVNRDERGNIIDYAARQVDGHKIKTDIWYRLEKGEFVEVKEERG